MKRVESDHSIYISRTQKETLIVAIYVDDLLLVGNSMDVINDFKLFLNEEYKMKDLGEAKFILGIKIEREGRCLSLSQE
jgi:hypothetical protein